jgi:hypothetical protein
MVGFEPSDTPIVTGGSKTGSKSIAPQGILRDEKSAPLIQIKTVTTRIDLLDSEQAPEKCPTFIIGVLIIAGVSWVTARRPV